MLRSMPLLAPSPVRRFIVGDCNVEQMLPDETCVLTDFCEHVAADDDGGSADDFDEVMLSTPRQMLSANLLPNAHCPRWGVLSQ